MEKRLEGVTELVGSWIVSDGHAQGEEICARIEWLISYQFRRIAASDRWGDWETLFHDPADGRYWERTYPQGEMHGGGPPRLRVLAEKEAQEKYNLP